MTTTVPVPDSIDPPLDILKIKGTWIEIQYPTRGKLFLNCSSSDDQSHVRIYKNGKIMGEQFRFLSDDVNSLSFNEFLADTLKKCGIIRKSDRRKLWSYRLEYRDGIPTYKPIDKNKRKRDLTRLKFRLEKQAAELKTSYEQKLETLRKIDIELKSF